MTAARIVYLTTAYDEHYHQLRGENIYRYLTWRKRRDLFACIEKATGLEVLILSPPPKATDRRQGRWLAPSETRFSSHKQLFCANWDIPKFRLPCSWIFYSLHVLRKTRQGDILIMENYELGQVIAVTFLRLFRKHKILLDYEDGYHLVHRHGWLKYSGIIAEFIGRKYCVGAFLAHPGIKERLPRGTTSVVVPGFFVPQNRIPARGFNESVCFLYSGSLDSARGVDFLLKALVDLPETGWRLDITGNGPMRTLVEETVRTWRRADQVVFHGTLAEEAYRKVLEQAHVGLNCQRSDDPIASVTFPSKVFTYFSTGLLVISTKASAVDQLLPHSCLFFSEGNPTDLAAAMIQAISDYNNLRNTLVTAPELAQYSIDGTASRLSNFFKAVVQLPT